LAIILIGITEGIPLFKSKMRKELITLGLLLGIALLLVIGYELGIPSPIVLMDELLSPFGRAIFR